MIHMIIGDALCLCLKITQLCRLCDRADAIEFYLDHPIPAEICGTGEYRTRLDRVR